MASVSYKLLGIAGWTTIMDDSAGIFNTVQAFAPAYKQEMLRTPLFDSPVVARAPLGNIEVTTPFQFSVAYANAGLAVAAVRQAASGESSPYAGLVGLKFHLQVVQDSETQYYPNAVVESYTPQVQGSSVIHAVTITSDQPTKTAPST